MLVLGFVIVIVLDLPRPFAPTLGPVVRTRTVGAPRLRALILLLHLDLPDPVPDPPLLADRRDGTGLLDTIVLLSSALLKYNSSFAPMAEAGGASRSPIGSGGFACTARAAPLHSRTSRQYVPDETPLQLIDGALSSAHIF